LSLLIYQDELVLKQLDFIQLTLPRRPGFIVSQPFGGAKTLLEMADEILDLEYK